MKPFTTDKLLSLGMALHADKRTMEHRVRSIFARRHSAWFASLAAVVLCGMIGVLGFTTACQPAEEGNQQEETVQTETLTVVQEDGTLKATEAPVSSHQPYEAPTNLEYTLDSHRDDIEIVIDADVIVPTQTDFSIYSMQRRAFTQQDADRILNQLVGDAEFVTLDSSTEPASKVFEFTTAIPQLVFRYGPEIHTADGGITSEWTEEAIAAAKADGNAAIIGRFKHENDEWMELHMVNEAARGSVRQSSLYFGSARDGIEVGDRNVSEKPFSAQQARAAAEQILSEIAPDYAIVQVQPHHYYDDIADERVTADNAYRFVCRAGAEGTHAVGSWNVVSPNYFHYVFGSSAWKLTSETVGMLGELSMIVDADGVLYMNWLAPMTAAQQAQPVALLPFAELQGKLDDLLTQSVSPTVEEYQQKYHKIFRLEISQLELGYKLLQEQGEVPCYRPVWSVCGKLYQRFNEQYELDKAPGVNQYLLDENDERVIAGRETVDNPQTEQTLFLLDAVDGTLINCIN